jgi:hypothetical protein
MVYRSANISAAPLLVGEPRIALVDEPVKGHLRAMPVLPHNPGERSLTFLKKASSVSQEIM